MNRGELIELKTNLTIKSEWWKKMIKASAWVDNGKGGNMNSAHELMKVEAKIEVVDEIINSTN